MFSCVCLVLFGFSRFSWFSWFLPQSNNMLTGVSMLAADSEVSVGVNVSVDGCLSLCVSDELVTCLR